MKNKWQCLVAAILISLLVAEILWYSPYGTSGKGSFAILHVFSQSQGEMTSVSIAYQLNAGFPMNATVVITPVKEVRQDLPIYVFYDTDYPTVGTDWILSAMLQGHLKAELYLREYSDDVKLANAEELEGLMSHEQISHRNHGFRGISILHIFQRKKLGSALDRVRRDTGLARLLHRILCGRERNERGTGHV